ncbi:MAG: hypothetical protein E7562_03350 [Ruminococcaceae bacterium]|nr:hypothetical protein [Oscillospiraceae bacterium]
MLKNNRQEKIIELIKEQIILTQEDLQNALKKEGFNVTQSTVSRDIKELRLVKGHDDLGNYRYIFPESFDSSPKQVIHYSDLFARSVKSVDYALNNVVIKCHNGMASSACVAVDSLFGDRMLGSLAGDDTIIIVTRSESDSAALSTELKKMI